MARLGNVRVGGKNPVRIMGILNTSPESFYKKSVSTGRAMIRNRLRLMESQGADFIDIGGMSTAPYLSGTVSEETESRRIIGAIKTIQNFSNLPISVDTCRARVAQDALEYGVEIINDVSGLKYDEMMHKVISKFGPSLILCAYSPKLVGSGASVTRRLLQDSLRIAKKSQIPDERIVFDPAIGFFRRTGRGRFFTKIRTDWLQRDLSMLRNLDSVKQGFPLLVSVSNKSFIGKILKNKDPDDRLFGSIAAEVVSVMNGADIIRTHNVGATRDAVIIASELKDRQPKSAAKNKGPDS